MTPGVHDVILYLTTNAELAGRFRVYLNNLQQGGDEDLASRNSLNIEPAELTKRIDEYASAGVFESVSVSGKPISPKRDFLEKPVDGKILIEHIRTALAMERELVARKRTETVVADRLNQLTRRERAVLDLLLSGKTLKEIASLNDVTVQTIWKQRESIFKKLEIENEFELARLAGNDRHDGAHRANLA